MAIAADKDINAHIKEEAYSVQFFGFSAKTFADSIYNAMVNSLEASVCQLNDYLIADISSSSAVHQTGADSARVRKPPDTSDGILTTLCRGCDQLSIHAQQKLEVFCDKLELYLDGNIFVVPRHVTLPEDCVHLAHNNTERPSVAMAFDGELVKLDAEIKSVAMRIATLKQDGRRLESTMAFYESRLATLDGIDEIVQLKNLEKSVINSASHTVSAS